MKMKIIIKNNYKIIISFVLGIIVSATSVYAVDAYIESKKVSYENKYTNKNNTQEAIDELYERSGIYKEKWVDPILNGADPVLKEPLIPVEIKPNGDVYYANENSEWYNYSEKRWANAVILIDNPSNENYQVGDHILESDIKSYFVWIPRYQYKIWDLGNYPSYITYSSLTDAKESSNFITLLWYIMGYKSKMIEVQFGTYDKYPKMIEPTSVGVYYTHPAFTLGSKNLNGIWVGKFETSGSVNNITVKPSVVSWKGIDVKTQFELAKEYEVSLDSHMMKNTEWGAVAYLSHSLYGIGTEININNNSEYKTGYSAVLNNDQSLSGGVTGTSDEKDKTQPWNTPTGYLASTTGNISGIYDMSGGTPENVAGFVEGNVGSGNINSGFTINELANYMATGYIDKYKNSNIDYSYSRRILGDATSEMGPFYFYIDKDGYGRNHTLWYGDHIRLAYEYNPWFIRGGSCFGNKLSGQFASDYPASSNAYAFRLVLSPQ